MRNYHGISPKTKKPFSPPPKIGCLSSTGRKKKTIGLCHECGTWVTIERPELTRTPGFWWRRHAAACHGNDRMENDDDWYVEDAVAKDLRAKRSKNCTSFQPKFVFDVDIDSFFL